LTGGRDERGAYTPAAVVLIAALFILASFVANAEAAFDARLQVADTAASAARAAAQASPNSLLHGSTLDAAGAETRAQEVLAAAGDTGTVNIEAGGRVEVTAQGAVHTPMPDMFGLNGRTVTATATAAATPGVTKAAAGADPQGASR
jgi:hypothetical protein